MKKHFSYLVISLLLVACTSSTPSRNLNSQLKEYSGGQVVGDVTSFYWYTERVLAPVSASDHVTSGDFGWYQTEYKWSNNQLQNVKRQGEQLDMKDQLQSFELEVRFSGTEAVYQRHKQGNKILPIPQSFIDQLQHDANATRTNSKEGIKVNNELIQGYWDGQRFTTCNDNRFDNLAFNQTLPTFVIKRLADVDSYMAFVGKLKPNAVEVDELLLIESDSFKCIDRPSFE